MRHSHDHSHPVTPEHPEGVRHSHFHAHDAEAGPFGRDAEGRQAHKAAPHEHEHRTTEVAIPLTFDVGTLEDIGLGGFKVGWLDAEDGGRKFSLTAGAGCGTPYLEASVTGGGQPSVYARADIRTLAQELWNQLRLAQEAAAVAKQDGEGTES